MSWENTIYRVKFDVDGDPISYHIATDVHETSEISEILNDTGCDHIGRTTFILPSKLDTDSKDPSLTLSGIAYSYVHNRIKLKKYIKLI